MLYEEEYRWFCGLVVYQSGRQVRSDQSYFGYKLDDREVHFDPGTNGWLFADSGEVVHL